MSRTQRYFEKRRDDRESAEGDFDHAIMDYDEAIRINPTYAIAFNNRAVAYYGKGDNDHAVADFDDAIRINPTFASAFQTRGRPCKRWGRPDDMFGAAGIVNNISSVPPAFCECWRHRNPRRLWQLHTPARNRFWRPITATLCRTLLWDRLHFTEESRNEFLRALACLAATAQLPSNS